MATPKSAWPKRLAPCSWLVNIHIAPPRTKARAAMVLAVGPVRLSTTTWSGGFQGRSAPPVPAWAVEAAPRRSAALRRAGRGRGRGAADGGGARVEAARG